MDSAAALNNCFADTLCCCTVLLRSAAVDYRLELKKRWKRGRNQIGTFWDLESSDDMIVATAIDIETSRSFGRMQAERQFRREVLRVFVDVFVDVFPGVLWSDPVVDLLGAFRKRFITRGLSLEREFTEYP